MYYVKTDSYTKISGQYLKKTTEKSPENQILEKGNYSWKSRSSMTKLKLDMYYVKKNLYTKFQVDISKDGTEKSRKPKCDWLTDWRMDGRTDGLTD